jgi:hypothetical protein
VVQRGGGVGEAIVLVRARQQFDAEAAMVAGTWFSKQQQCRSTLRALF